MLPLTTDNAIRRRSRWVWIVLLTLSWEAFRRIFHVDPLLMPPLPEILAEFGRSLVRGQLPVRWIRSILTVFAGMGMGIFLALAAVLISGFSRQFASLWELLSSLFHPLPGLALLPLVILVSGTGTTAVLIVIVHAVVWPVSVNLVSGVRSLEPSWTQYARILNLRPLATFVRIRLPGVFPHLISGIRTAWARSWRAFIASEMVFGAVGRSGGLGWQLFESRVMMDTPALYSTILAVMITGMLMEETLLTRWERSVRRKWGESPV